MMKTILVILFAITSSSALAQRHVPGGGPVGSPGNPGTNQPGGYNPGNGGGHHGGGTHVPGGGPQGPRGGGVIIVQPNYPGNYPGNFPNNYPNNYPNTYPSPNNYPVGPCVINSQYSGNTQYYTVYDGRGNYILSSYDYYQAMSTAQNYDRMGYCNGIKVNGQPNPYPNPNPNPYPQTYCTVMQGQDAYGRQFFRVLDRAGRIIYTSQNYGQALQVSQTDARCFQY